RGHFTARRCVTLGLYRRGICPRPGSTFRVGTKSRHCGREHRWSRFSFGGLWRSIPSDLALCSRYVAIGHRVRHGPTRRITRCRNLRPSRTARHHTGYLLRLYLCRVCHTGTVFLVATGHRLRHAPGRLGDPGPWLCWHSRGTNTPRHSRSTLIWQFWEPNPTFNACDLSLVSSWSFTVTLGHLLCHQRCQHGIEHVVIGDR